MAHWIMAFISNLVHSLFQPFMIMIGLVTLQIDSQQLIFWSSCDIIPLLGVPRNKLLFLALKLNLNIEPWLEPQLSCIGLVKCSRIWVSFYLLLNLV